MWWALFEVDLSSGQRKAGGLILLVLSTEKHAQKMRSRTLRVS
jgi:hypothetical protein